MSLAVVRDLRDPRAPAGPDEIAAFETDVLAGFVLARAAAGLADATISSDVGHLEQLRAWFGRPLWDMEPPDADAYFGTILRGAAKGTRLGRSQALKTYFLFLEIRHKIEIHQLTGRVAECPVDEMNRPRGAGRAALRIPPSAVQVNELLAGWRGELATCRKFAPAARNYAAAKLMSEVGLRVNEASHLDLDDIKWDLGPFGKLHVRKGKGARGSGPRERMVPLIRGAGTTLRWFIEDVWCCFDDDHARPGAPLFCSERRDADGTAAAPGHAACPAAVLRLAAVPGRYGPGRDPADPRSCLGRHDHELHSRSRHPHRGRLDHRPATRRRAPAGIAAMTTGLAAASLHRRVIAGGRPPWPPEPAGGVMKWNLRLAAANRGIWKASELQRMLAEAGLVISAGKMSGLWSGRPASIKLDDLDVLCAVVGCGVEELLIAEGSDWCWWYGPEHESANRPEFDQLYRSHLANVYRFLDLAPPEELSRPILRMMAPEVQVAPSGPISPVIDGEVTSYFEWIGAGAYRVDERSGSMHGKKFVIQEVFFGSNGASFYLRADFHSGYGEELGGMEARITVQSLNDAHTSHVTVDFAKGARIRRLRPRWGGCWKFGFPWRRWRCRRAPACGFSFRFGRAGCRSTQCRSKAGSR